MSDCEVQGENDIVCVACWMQGDAYFDGEQCQACPEELPNWNEKLKKCVSACPRETPMFENGECKTCVEYFASHSLWDAVDGECVGQCENHQHVMGADGVCHNCAEIYPNRPYSDGFYCLACTEELGGLYFYDGKCVQECQDDAPVADEHRICRTCGEIDPYAPVWNGRACEACPEGSPRWDGENCAEECPELVVNRKCRTCAEISPGWPVWDEGLKRCRKCSADDGGVYWTGESCAPTCQPEKPTYDENRVCAEKCADHQFWTGSACADACLDEAPAYGADRICSACPANTPLWSPMARECVKACPEGSTAKDKICTRCERFFSRKTGACVDTCRFGADAAGVCRPNRCPRLFYVSSGGRLECVDACVQTRPYLFGSECLSRAECEAMPGYATNADGECVISSGTCAPGKYLYAEGETSRCLTADECAELNPRGYAYAGVGECSSVAPAADGRFDADLLKGNVYACSEGDLLDFISPERRCVGRFECIFSDLKGIVADDSTCVGRDAWLAADALNFVDSFFRTGKYAGDGEFPTDTTQICKL